MSLAQDVYRKLPGWIQTLALNAYAVRLRLRRQGRDFRRLRGQWAESQWWEPKRLRAWQDRRVRGIVRFAYEHVPFYQERWDEHGVGPADVQRVSDLPRLPILEKEEVRRAGKRLTPDDLDVDLVHGHTSGTTGSPLSVWYDRRMSVVNHVADWRQKSWGGLEPGDWWGLFLGRVVVPTDRQDPPFWRTNYLDRQVWFSAFHMSPENLDHYVREIRRRDLGFLEGYPSTLYILAEHVASRGERLPMEAVFTSSETLHRVQREKIEAAFDCEIFDFYGLAERVIFAGECERHQGKHLFQEYGVTELVDDEGEPVEEGETGWLTGTTLWNRGMPLIRYRTSDLSRRRGRCGCGRGLGLIDAVTTKAEDIVVTPDGRFVSPSVLTHSFKPFDAIRKSQIVQEEVDTFRIRLVVDERFGDEQERALRADLEERLGEGVELAVEYEDEIPPEPSGKFRWVVSRVSHDRELSWEEIERREPGGTSAGNTDGPAGG